MKKLGRCLQANIHRDKTAYTPHWWLNRRRHHSSTLQWPFSHLPVVNYPPFIHHQGRYIVSVCFLFAISVSLTTIEAYKPSYLHFGYWLGGIYLISSLFALVLGIARASSLSITSISDRLSLWMVVNFITLIQGSEWCKRHVDEKELARVNEETAPSPRRQWKANNI